MDSPDAFCTEAFRTHGWVVIFVWVTDVITFHTESAKSTAAAHTETAVKHEMQTRKEGLGCNMTPWWRKGAMVGARERL